MNNIEQFITNEFVMKHNENMFHNIIYAWPDMSNENRLKISQVLMQKNNIVILFVNYICENDLYIDTKCMIIHLFKLAQKSFQIN